MGAVRGSFLTSTTFFIVFLPPLGEGNNQKPNNSPLNHPNQSAKNTGHYPFGRCRSSGGRGKGLTRRREGAKGFA
jgi:hypothetical protein